MGLLVNSFVENMSKISTKNAYFNFYNSLRGFIAFWKKYIGFGNYFVLIRRKFK
jgi:hypothetical protein